MRKKSKRAVVLWTGGKDSALALHLAQGLGYAITSLVTFAPAGAHFLAHPLDFMAYQAEALGLPHQIVEIREPFREGYERAISALRGEGISTLITGDIAEVDGYPNWIRECSRDSRMKVITPLWGRDRLGILQSLMLYGFRVIFSGVKKPWFSAEWVGRELNPSSVAELQRIAAETGLDLCGEEGEYHTLVLSGPSFQKSIQIKGYARWIEDSLMYMEIQGCSLEPAMPWA